MFDGFLRNQIVLEALIAFGLGVGLERPAWPRARQGWGSQRRFLTFADQVKLRLVGIAIGTLLVALTVAVLFRSATTGAYLIALVLAILQTLCVILGIFVLDTILRTPALIRGLFRSSAQRTDDVAAHDHVNDR